MKIQMIFLTIPRWHCIDLVLKNIELAAKTGVELSLVLVVSGGDTYFNYVTQRFKDMNLFNNIKIVKMDNVPVEHDKIRDNGFSCQENKNKIENIFKAYQVAIDNIDFDVDYYWVIEDDTLFPFDTLERYMKLIDVFKADIISGVSYYWHSNHEYKRNFWNIIEKEHLIGNKESDGKISIETITEQDSGIIKIGATGLGNVLAKAETVWGWKPAEQLSMNICNGGINFLLL